MYVAVKGGERAIERSWDVLAKKRRGDVSVPSCPWRRFVSRCVLRSRA